MVESVNFGQSEQKPKKRKKIITAVIFFVIIAAIIYLGWTEGSRWWQERKKWIDMGFAHDKFPFKMLTERELVEKGLWSGESPALNAVPTRTRPEETYAKFRQALVDGDMDKAAECFIDNQQEAWRKSLYEIKDKNLLQGMLNDLPEKLEDNLNRDLSNKSWESYDYVLSNDPEKWARIIEFYKNWNGDWLIGDIH